MSDNQPQTLADYLAAHPFVGPFRPRPHYSRDGDMLSLHWSGASCYAEPYHDPETKQWLFDLLRDQETNAIVGVNVYGVGRMVDGERSRT